VNELVCLARVLKILLFLPMDTLARGEWHRLTLRMEYKTYRYLCYKGSTPGASLAYVRRPNIECTELQRSRKRKYLQLRHKVFEEA
jgi:hypothetical protein